MRLPIPDDWNGQDWCKFAICWPDSLKYRAILRGYVTQLARGWTWDEKTGNLLAAIETGKLIRQHNIDLEESIMSCNDGQFLLEGMAEIASAIRYASEQGCACSSSGQQGSQGAGTQPEPPSPTITEEGTTEPPEGFDDWGQYRAYKCGMATRIANDLIVDLTNLTTIQIVGVTLLSLATGLGPLLITPAAWAVLASVAAILLAIASLGITWLTDAKDAAVGFHDDLVCELYLSVNTDNAITRWQVLVNDYVDTAYPDQPRNYYIKTLINLFATTDSLNRLQERDQVNPPSSADCSGCTSSASYWTYRWGSVDATSSTTVDMSSGNPATPCSEWSTSQRTQINVDVLDVEPDGWPCEDDPPSAGSGVLLERIDVLAGGGGGLIWRYSPIAGPAVQGTTFPVVLDPPVKVSRADTRRTTGSHSVRYTFAEPWQGEGPASF